MISLTRKSYEIQPIFLTISTQILSLTYTELNILDLILALKIRFRLILEPTNQYMSIDGIYFQRNNQNR